MLLSPHIVRGGRQLLAAWLCLIPSIAYATLDQDGTMYRDQNLGIKLPIPEGWTATTYIGYPPLLLLLYQSKMNVSISLAKGSIESKLNITQYIQDNNQGLISIGYKITSIRSIDINNRRVWEVLATLGNKIETHQMYFTHGPSILILTLSTPSGLQAKYKTDLYWLLKSLLQSSSKNNNPL